MTSTVLPTPAPPNIAALPPCANGVSRSMTLMPVGGECLAVVADSAGQIDQSAEHRVPDRHLERPAGRMGDHAATQPGGRLQCDGANRRFVQMRLDLGDDRSALVGRDDQGAVDRRQARAIKGDIQNGAAHRGHPAIDCLRLRHRIVQTGSLPKVPRLSSRGAMDRPGSAARSSTRRLEVVAALRFYRG